MHSSIYPSPLPKKEKGELSIRFWTQGAICIVQDQRKQQLQQSDIGWNCFHADDVNGNQMVYKHYSSKAVWNKDF